MAGAGAKHIDQVMAVVHGSEAPCAVDAVRRSWIRSAEHFRLDPSSHARPSILTWNELREWRDAEAELVSVARIELDRLYKMVRPTGYVVLLCDRNGLVIEHRGEEAMAEQFRRWGTWVGGVWSEEAEGTNGIGTCIAEGRPVTIHRNQHFRSRHIDLSCSGAPIHNAEGVMIGVLDVSSIDPDLSEHSHALTGALTIAAARAIEERLFRRRFRRAWVVAVASREEPAAGMLLAVDQDQRIVGAGPIARRALGLDHRGAGPAT